MYAAHGCEEEGVRRRDDSDVVLVRVQGLEQRDASPACTKDDQLGLVLDGLVLLAVIVIDKVVGNGQVLGASSSRV